MKWSLLALNTLIFFKNIVMKETKIRSIKKTFERLPLYSAKATHTWLVQIRNNREAIIFNLDHRFYTLQKYVVYKSGVESGHTFMEISLNLTM